MVWDYRICKTTKKDVNGERCSRYSIHEVYYKNRKKSVILNITANEIRPCGLSLKDISWDLHAMSAAATKPVLDMDKMDELWKIGKKVKTKKVEIKRD